MMFKELLFDRVHAGRYTPLPGQRAMCHQNVLGVVTDIQVDSAGELIFKGHYAHIPDKNWQSKDPRPPAM